MAVQGVEARSQFRRAVVAVTTVAVLMVLPCGTRAYRTLLTHPGVDGDVPPAWQSGFAIAISSDHPGNLSFSSVESAFHEARAVWNGTGCQAPTISYGGVSVHSGVLGDGVSTIEWVYEGWTNLGLPSDSMATTDVQLVQQADGRWDIDEADIRINAEHFTWVVGEPTPTSTQRNLIAVLTHELGHALGLQHPCETPARGDASICDSSFEDTMMYPFYDGRARLTRSQDDVDGLCAVYPCSGEDCTPTLPCQGEGCVPSSALCFSDLNCPAAAHCVDFVCVNDPLFDPCTTHDDCTAGVCGSEGYCTVSCMASCGEQSVCRSDECAPVGRLFGETCEFSDDCQSEVCLDRDGEARCSRTCAGATSCPLGYTCGDVDGQAVCSLVRHGSCSVVTLQTDGETARAWWALNILLLALWTRRESRSRRDNQRERKSSLSRPITQTCFAQRALRHLRGVK